MKPEPSDPVIARAKPVAICLFIATALCAALCALYRYIEYRGDLHMVTVFAQKGISQ